MSLSSAPSSLSDSSSSQSDTLLQNEIIVEHPKDGLQNEIIEEDPKDTLQHLADSPSLHEDTRSTMPPRNRSRRRNVHIFDARDRSTSIGGLVLTAGVTNTNLYDMIEIFVIFGGEDSSNAIEGEYILRNESSIAIEKDDSMLLPGNYYIDSPSNLLIDPIQINNETPLLRTISLQSGFRVKAFTNAVRSRDRRCVITGMEYLDDDDDDWWGFEAAHIFPLAYEQHWKDSNYSRWISITPERGGTINSIQNGLLLRSDIHQGFDTYKFSINPDDNYKIICFSRDRYGIAGKYLDRRLLDDPQRPVDQLLRWHFRQAVLTNMKGAGEPVFEHDFPPGSDIVGSILEGPKAAKRMEFELFSRMATQFDLTE
ncbi:hypothetical protein EG329_010195 [Mollisiaceae sp. DMI_Dod_QoI]|nr:hypothetical protein EG329_010195 [Helotiales sp. DMI_Dod_QoI]